MSDNAFLVGDVVQLKSGSPPFTVKAIDDETGNLSIFWFDAAHGQFRDASVHADCMDPVAAVAKPADKASKPDYPKSTVPATKS